MKGRGALTARLQALEAAARIAAVAGGREAMEQTAAYARRVVPVRTGRLRASIISVDMDSRREVQVRCPYAVYVELGTRRMSARPYLMPGVREADYFARVARAWKEAMK